MARVHVERVEIDDPEGLALTGEEMGAWLNSWSVEEHMKYADQYVAVSVDHKVVASDRSAKGLERKLRELGSPRVLIFLHPPADARIIYTLRG
jgi:hypothetical protein